MNHQTSRSEKKRQAKNIEMLSRELVALPEAELKKAPCDDFLKDEIRLTRKLKGGSLKRQIKYIARELRQNDPQDLLDFLEEIKGSKLRRKSDFHTIERLRDDIINDAIALADQLAEHSGERQIPDDKTFRRHSAALQKALETYPGLDVQMLVTATLRYLANRKPAHSREIFRQLMAAHEQQKFQ